MVCQLVAAYFRWLGALDRRGPLSQQLQHAIALDQDFRLHPDRFTPQQLKRSALPGWIYDFLEADPAWIRFLQQEPPLWLRTRAGCASSVAAELGDCTFFRPEVFADTLRYQGAHDLFHSAAFTRGDFEIQDLSSQAVGLICQPKPGETWWDACAGEGGKTLHLAELMNRRGLIWATDNAAWRLDRLKRRAARAQVFNYRARPWLGTRPLPFKTLFDGVLVDAPCSGVGTWHRNPQARWTTAPADLARLAALQAQLLDHVVELIKPGGKLVYAVCTATRCETIEVAAAFSRAHPECASVPITNPLVASSQAPAGELQLWSQHHGGNGMFVAMWKKAPA